MAELESAEEFARQKLGVHLARLEQAIGIIEARDNAVRLALLWELSPLLEHSGRNAAILDLLRAKYSPTSKEASGG